MELTNKNVKTTSRYSSYFEDETDVKLKSKIPYFNDKNDYNRISQSNDFDDFNLSKLSAKNENKINGKNQ